MTWRAISARPHPRRGRQDSRGLGDAATRTAADASRALPRLAEAPVAAAAAAEEEVKELGVLKKATAEAAAAAAAAAEVVS